MGLSDRVLTLSPAADRACVSINIIFDDVVEGTEVFLVIIESEDPSVQITLNGAVVAITDSTSEFNDPDLLYCSWSLKKKHIFL